MKHSHRGWPRRRGKVICGDAYCIDTTSTSEGGHHPIVLFSHKIIDEEASVDVIQRARLEMASSLDDFLERFTNGKLCDEPWHG